MIRWIFALFFIIALPLQAQAEKILDIQELETDDGIQIWLVEDHSVPVVAMNFGFPGGMAYDPLDKTGRAYLMSIMLDEGAGERDSQQFQKALADNAIDLSFSAGRDYFNGGIRTLSRNTDVAANLLSEALRKPRFDEDALNRMKSATEASIKQDMTNPGWIAARSFNGLMFGDDAYGRPGKGTLETLATLGADDLRTFARQQFVKDGLIVSIAGDMNADQAIKFVNDTFGGLRQSAEVKQPDEDAAFKNAGTTYLYEYDNPQTHIIAGHKGIAVNDPDWPAAQLINYTLGGGGFDSRLMEEIREKRGLTYGVSSYMSDLVRAPTMQSSLSASNDKANEALELLKAEWQKMGTTGPSETELQNAKDYLTGSLILSLTSTDSIAAVMSGLQKKGFDKDYINTRNERLRAVSGEDARIVAGRLLQPDNLSLIHI